jgi:hypothetical protein
MPVGEIWLERWQHMMMDVDAAALSPALSEEAGCG